MAAQSTNRLEHTARSLMVRRLRALESLSGSITIDADTHITAPEECSAVRVGRGDNYFHGRPISADELVAEMDAAGVDMALSWQNPSATFYVGDWARDFAALEHANSYVARSAQRFPTRIIPAGWTDPKALGTHGARAMVDLCVGRFGFTVVKMNPAQNGFPIDGESVAAVVQRIIDWGAIPAFHFGADTQFTPADGLEAVARRIAPLPLLAVHMGGGGASYLDAESLYLRSRELGLMCSNIHYVCSARRDTHTESDLITFQHAGEPYCRNISLGSDAPYGRVSFHFGGYRALLHSLSDADFRTRHNDSRVRGPGTLFDESSIRNYLGRNLVDLLIAAHRRILGRA